MTAAAESVNEDFALFSDLLESSQNPVLILDFSLAILHVNSAAERLFRPYGIPANPLNLVEFCGPDYVYLCDLVADALHQGTPLRGKDVTVAGEAFTLTLVPGKVSWVLGLRPVTRELSLEYQAKRFRQHRNILLEAMDGIEGSVVIVNVNGSIRYMNRFTRKHVGDLMHGVGMNDWPTAAGFYREDGITLLEGPYRIFPRALKGQTVIDEAIVIRNEITGHAIKVQASATPVHDEKGRIVSAIGWFHYMGPHHARLTAVNVTDLNAGDD